MNTRVWILAVLLLGLVGCDTVSSRLDAETATNRAVPTQIALDQRRQQSTIDLAQQAAADQSRVAASQAALNDAQARESDSRAQFNAALASESASRSALVDSQATLVDSERKLAEQMRNFQDLTLTLVAVLGTLVVIAVIVFGGMFLMRQREPVIYQIERPEVLVLPPGATERSLAVRPDRDIVRR
ncbi:MAG: hypothetical protein WCF84_02375 [Anaerolineae bacterium]